MISKASIAALAIASSPAPAVSDVIYAVSGQYLYEIDPAAGTSTAIALFSFNLWNVAESGVPNRLYITRQTTWDLYRYDTVTKVVELVLDLPQMNALCDGRDGYLYGGTTSGGLYRIDPNGSYTLIGDGPDYAGDLAADVNGNLFGSTETRTIVCVNKATGAHSAVLVNTGIRFLGLGFTLDGLLWGGDDQGNLYKVDLAAGTTTFVTNLSSSGLDPILDFSSQPGRPVVAGQGIVTLNGDGMTCQGSVEPGGSLRLHVAATLIGVTDGGVSHARFSLEGVPTDWQWQVDPAPGVFYAGDPVTAVTLADFGGCEPGMNDVVPIMMITITWPVGASAVQDRNLTIGRRTGAVCPGSPIVTGCGSTCLTDGDICVTGARFILNPVETTCVVQVEQRDWGWVKRLYR